MSQICPREAGPIRTARLVPIAQDVGPVSGVGVGGRRAQPRRFWSGNRRHWRPVVIGAAAVALITGGVGWNLPREIRKLRQAVVDRTPMP